jgi:hypothetical protein
MRERDSKPFSPMAVFHFCPDAWPRAASGRADPATDVSTELARTFNALRRFILRDTRILQRLLPSRQALGHKIGEFGQATAGEFGQWHSLK